MINFNLKDVKDICVWIFMFSKMKILDVASIGSNTNEGFGKIIKVYQYFWPLFVSLVYHNEFIQVNITSLMLIVCGFGRN